MRTFIALELPSRIKRDLGGIQKDLIKVGIEARWARPEIAHLTLAFLGSITPDKVKPIGKILDEVAGQIEPARLHFLKIGCFPSPANARVVFVEVGGEIDKLNALAIKIRKRLKKEKIWFDRKPFVSHITLGRIRKKQNLTKSIRKIKIKKIKFVAGEVSLTKSTLTETGPVYNQIK